MPASATANFAFGGTVASTTGQTFTVDANINFGTNILNIGSNQVFDSVLNNRTANGTVNFKKNITAGGINVVGTGTLGTNTATLFGGNGSIVVGQPGVFGTTQNGLAANALLGLGTTTGNNAAVNASATNPGIVAALTTNTFTGAAGLPRAD